MNIPKRYEDLTVNQFQELEALKNDDTLDKLDKSIKRLSILSGKSVEYIETLKPSLVYEKLLDAIFLIEPINSMASPESFTLAYKKFRYIKSIDQYTTSQQKDFTEILKANNNDYIACLPELMAICHQELTLFGWKYKPENHFKNVELFKQSKLKDSLGAVFFYSNCLKSYSVIIEDCLLKANEMIQAHVKTMTDDQEFQTFLKGGDGNTRLA
jgi:hypothetical protein